MKKFGILLLTLVFSLFIINPVQARDGASIWLDGHILDENIPVKKMHGKFYIPVDMLPEYYGLYGGYSPDGLRYGYCEPEYVNSGNYMSLDSQSNISYDESEQILAIYSEVPKYLNGHMYQSISDARLFLNDSISYDPSNNILSLSPDYSPGKNPNKVNIIIDGKKVPSNFNPFLQKNRTMVPLRFITEAIGGKVYWHEELTDDMQGITISKREEALGLTMFINKCGSYESEIFYRNDTFPVVRGETTYVPLRFVADYLGLKVKWDQNSRTVVLTSGGQRNMRQYIDDYMAKQYEGYLEDGEPEGMYALIFS